MTETLLDQMKRELNRLGIRLSEHQMDQLFTYYEMLVEKNKVMNLIVTTEEYEVVAKHFSDSLSFLAVIQEMEKTGKQGVGWFENSRIIDVGTGVGSPGIPLKIVFPGIRATPLDSLNRRVKFFEEVCDALNLESVTLIHGRAEDTGWPAKRRKAYGLCVPRAVVNLTSFSEYCMSFVKVSGYFVPYKSRKTDEELVQTQRAIGLLGGEQKMAKKFLFPDTDATRSPVVIEKIKAISKKYPCKAGMPVREPLR